MVVPNMYVWLVPLADEVELVVTPDEIAAYVDGASSDVNRRHVEAMRWMTQGDRLKRFCQWMDDGDPPEVFGFTRLLFVWDHMVRAGRVPRDLHSVRFVEWDTSDVDSEGNEW